LDDHGVAIVNRRDGSRSGGSGFVASWVDWDLAKILHRLAPALVKPLGKTLRKLAIPNEQ
jgi:hypothetical protein